jgi:hypothetical protein
MAATAPTIGSLFHQGGKIWPNGYDPRALEDNRSDPEPTLEL